MRNYLFLLMLGIIVFSFISGCSKSVFNGKITGNDVEFIMDYSLLNKTETHEMDLTKDDVIDITVESESGVLDIIVSDTDGNEIYRGNDAETGKFKLTITKTNKYRFSVTGKNAKGSVSFKLIK